MTIAFTALRVPRTLTRLRSGPARTVPAFSADSVATADLLALVALGNRKAFEVVFDRTVGLVLDVTGRVLPLQQSCEDVTRGVFVEVWHTARQFDPAHSGAHAWLLNLAHTRAVEHAASLV